MEEYQPQIHGYEIPIKNVTGNANEKIQNKNLFDYTKYLNLVSTYEYEDSGYHCKSIPLKPNKQYRVSFPLKETTSTILLLNNKSHVNDAGFLDTRNTTGNKSFTTDNTGNLYIGVLYSSDSAINDLLENLKLQIEQGTTATSYVPHAEQNLPFTFASGQRAMEGTTLEDDGIHNTWKQRILNGTEDIIENTGYRGLFQITISNIGQNFAKIQVISSHFKGVTGNYMNSNLSTSDKEISNFNSNRIFMTYRQYANNLEGFITWLAQQYANGTPVIVEYELETEEIIPYNSTQQAQYEAIKNARSYADVTYVTSTSDEEGFDMKVTAIGDANKIQEQQNNEIETIKSRLDLLEG